MDETRTALAAAKRYAPAWLGDDVETILDCDADDITLHYLGDNPYSVDRVGQDAALSTLLETGVWAPLRPIAVDEIVARRDGPTIVARELSRFDDTEPKSPECCGVGSRAPGSLIVGPRSRMKRSSTRPGVRASVRALALAPRPPWFCVGVGVRR